MKLTFKTLLASGRIEKKLQKIMQHQDIDWNQIVFTDESSFHTQPVIRCA